MPCLIFSVVNAQYVWRVCQDTRVGMAIALRLLITVILPNELGGWFAGIAI